MTDATQSDRTDEKLAWEKPEVSVVATTAEITGGDIDDDEDFTGTPS